MLAPGSFGLGAANCTWGSRAWTARPALTFGLHHVQRNPDAVHALPIVPTHNFQRRRSFLARRMSPLRPLPRAASAAAFPRARRRDEPRALAGRFSPSGRVMAVIHAHANANG